MWAIRTLRVAPTLAAMAMGDTRNAMISNAVRTLAFPGVIAVASAGLPLSWVAACGVVGELLALAANLWRLSESHALAPGLYLRPSMPCGLAATLATAAAVGGMTQSWSAAIVVSALLIGMSVSSMLYVFPKLRHAVRSILLRTDRAILVQRT
jgi:hypothetical protein